MDIETFRWFMSTVPQVLGALTGILLAGYLIWVQQLRNGLNEIIVKLFKYDQIDKNRLFRLERLEYIEKSDSHSKELNTYITLYNEYIVNSGMTSTIQYSLIFGLFILVASLLILINDIWICRDIVLRYLCTYVILLSSVTYFIFIYRIIVRIIKSFSLK